MTFKRMFTDCFFIRRRQPFPVKQLQQPTVHALDCSKNRQRDELDEPDVFLSRETRARPNQS